MDNCCDWRFITTSAEATRRLGRMFGRHLHHGAVIRLNGDLGCGKTCFVKGLAEGLEVPQGYTVTSPTYALMHDYPGRLTLVHADLYRIHDEIDAESIGLWDVMDDGHVVAVEWANRIEDGAWPDESISIDFKRIASGTRQVTAFGCGLQVADLIREIGTLWDGADRHSP